MQTVSIKLLKFRVISPWWRYLSQHWEFQYSLPHRPLEYQNMINANSANFLCQELLATKILIQILVGQFYSHRRDDFILLLQLLQLYNKQEIFCMYLLEV